MAISDPKARIALVGETEHDTREVMVEGVSGLLAVHPPHERPQWVPSRRRLEWPNGAVAQAFSAEDPESLRGPQFSAAWCDELAKWRHAEATFDMLQFGLRLGERPRQVMTTTPRPIALSQAPDCRSARRDHAGRHDSERAAISRRAFIETMLSRYGGTRLGRQEIDGEIIEERDRCAVDARRSSMLCRVDAAPASARASSSRSIRRARATKQADACGLVAAGRGEDGSVYVLADETAARPVAAGLGGEGDCVVAAPCRPTRWWRRSISGRRHGARGDRGRRPHGAGASRCGRRAANMLRAEPVAQLYEQGRVKHVGAFPGLEDEMCDFGLDGLSSGRSPDRLDALVWAITALSFGARGEPRMRLL